MSEQGVLLEMPEGPAVAASAEELGARKYVAIDRSQLCWMAMDLEGLIGEDHKARAIWELTGQLDLKRFEGSVATVQGQVGRPAWEPRLLVSVWLYSYSEGVTSARELEGWMEQDPGLRWLTGLQSINHHTLSDFRVRRQEELDDLFTQLLVILEEGGWVKLEQVMHDGSKIRAQAGVDSFRRKGTIERKWEAARQLAQEDPQSGGSRRQQAARQRARREREERLRQAMEEVEKQQACLKKEEEKQEVRVSVSEPEARKMQHGDRAITPAYNAQVSTDAEQGVIVGADLIVDGDDYGALPAAMDQVKTNLGRYAQQAVADGGCTNLKVMKAMEEREIDFIGSLRDPRERSEAAMKSVGIDPRFAPHFFIFQEAGETLQCPAGKTLAYVRVSKKGEKVYAQYQNLEGDCQSCEFQKACCPNTPEKGRTVSVLEKEPGALRRFREKMSREEAQQAYRRRGAVAEFPFAWLKEKFRLRKFRVFGRVKARTELMWACLTHNMMIWKRLVWVPLRIAAKTA